MTTPTPTPIVGPSVRMFYIDDSGSPNDGWIVYSWIEVTLLDWRIGLRAWLDLRKKMFAQHNIPASYELHATKFLGGRGNPSLDSSWNGSKQTRTTVVREALATIGTCPVLRVGTVYRQTTARGKAYSRERGVVYSKLVDHVDNRLGLAGEHGLIFMDGDGRDSGYYNAHRSLKLAHRNVIEDPLFQHSHRSQWVQMADLTAYAAYQSLIKVPAKRFAWDWYPNLLGPIEVSGGPIAV
ncbi:DUF3800 domain-containing protein [Micromonospora sp. WMMD723]|uniref:DUF3800 domain-containing protein n=1 Tax=Micromonospora sp. WMMD723 TaxID=3403465 RepID=UPI003CF13EEE